MEQQKKSNYWLKSGILNLFQNFSSAFFGVAGFWVLTRMLGTDEFGQWGLFLQVTTVLDLVRNGLIQNALIKFIASKPDEKASIISSSMVITVTLTVACIVLNLCFAGMFARLENSPQLDELLYTYNILFVITGVLTIVNCIEQANLSYQGVVVSGFVRSVIFVGFISYCYFFSGGTHLINLLYAQMVAAAVALIISWYYTREYLRFSFHYSKKWIADIYHYGKFGFGNSISSILSGTIDQWMLGSLMSPAAAGSFRAAITVTNLIDIPTNTIATIVFPQSAKRMETEGKSAIKYLYERSVGIILAILVPAILFLYVFDKQIMTLLASDKFLTAVPILNVTLLYAVLIPFGRQVGTILDSIGKTKTTFYIVLTTATINLILNFLFIKRWGVLGAAYATFCSNIVGFAIAQTILYRELKVNPLNSFIYMVHFYPEFYHTYVKKLFIRKSSEA